jgi:hypothetical protein
MVDCEFQGSEGSTDHMLLDLKAGFSRNLRQVPHLATAPRYTSAMVILTYDVEACAAVLRLANGGTK